MKGRNHMAVNAAAAWAASWALAPALSLDTSGALAPLAGALSMGGGAAGLAAGAAGLLIGSLAPDVDCPTSTLGRFNPAAHLAPGAHRTWTHALWVPAALMAAGLAAGPLVFWLGAGWLLHVLADALSPMGVPFAWPLSARAGVALYGKGRVPETLFALACAAGLCAFACARWAGAA